MGLSLRACARARSCLPSYCDRCDLLVGLDGFHVIEVVEQQGRVRVVVESARQEMACPPTPYTLLVVPDPGAAGNLARRPGDVQANPDQRRVRPPLPAAPRSRRPRDVRRMNRRPGRVGGRGQPVGSKTADKPAGPAGRSRTGPRGRVPRPQLMDHGRGRRPLLCIAASTLPWAIARPAVCGVVCPRRASSSTSWVFARSRVEMVLKIASVSGRNPE